MARDESRSPAPDGITEDHVRPAAKWQRHGSPLGLVVFGAVVVLSLSGLLGHERTWSAEGGAARLQVHSPETIRNGEFFEIRISVESDEPIGELVIGVDQALWEDMTVNTMLPAPAEEEGTEGQFRFTFAELVPETPFLLKVDLQVNPDIVGGNAGAVSIYDGQELLTAAPIEIAVLP